MYIRVEVEGETAKEVKVEEIPWSMLIPVLVLGILCFVVGVLWLVNIPAFPLMDIMDAVNAELGLGVVP